MWASPVVIVVKNVSANAGDIRDVGSVPELGRSPWRRAWQPTLVCLENPVGRGGGGLPSMGLQRVRHN